jgi:two-component system response regulator
MLDSAQPRRILLVEDKPNDQRLTIRALRRSRLAEQVRVDVASTGPDALEYLFGAAEREPAALPAVVLLDLKLPMLDGLEVLRRLRADARTATQPVVILTSSRQEEDRLAAYRLGANSYVRKPVASEAFEEAVQQLGLYWLLLNEGPPGATD